MSNLQRVGVAVRGARPGGRRRAIVLLAALGIMVGLPGAASANNQFLFLQPGFTQELYGTAPPPGSIFGGVAFAPNADVWVDGCAFAGSPLDRFDNSTTTPMNGSNPHPLVAGSPFPSNAGCGLTNHPDGFMYSNTSLGVTQINASTGAPTGVVFGAGGNALGITPDPQTGNLVYVAADSTILTAPPGGASSTFSAVTTGNFVDGIAFTPDGRYLFVSNRSPSFRLTILDRAGNLVQHVPMTSEPDGISFHATAPKFVVTNNTDGSMTRFDFPADDYTMPPVLSVFASGGFRGDLTQVGPDGCIYLTQAGTRFDDLTTSPNNSIVRICPGFAPPPGVGNAVQHYKAYEFEHTKFERVRGVTLTDQFGTSQVIVDEQKLLLNPVEKRFNGETSPIAQRDLHSVCYSIKDDKDGDFPKFQKRQVIVENQFGSVTLKVEKPRLLCAPASKSETETPPGDVVAGNHYECYEVHGKWEKIPGVGLTDQFGEEQVVVKEPKLLCNPAEKRIGDTVSPIVREDDHLLCYEIKDDKDADFPKFESRSVTTRDQFGVSTLKVKKPKQLCVPSKKTLVD